MAARSRRWPTFAACAAVWTMPQTRSSATISMTVNYAAPAVKTDLVARARVRRSGKRIASIAVEIRDQQGALIADALVTSQNCLTRHQYSPQFARPPRSTVSTCAPRSHSHATTRWSSPKRARRSSIRRRVRSWCSEMAAAISGRHSNGTRRATLDGGSAKIRSTTSLARWSNAKSPSRSAKPRSATPSSIRSCTAAPDAQLRRAGQGGGNRRTEYPRRRGASDFRSVDRVSRGAAARRDARVYAPGAAFGFDPCPGCVPRSCISACPVGAVSFSAGWDVPKCLTHRSRPSRIAPGDATREPDA